MKYENVRNGPKFRRIHPLAQGISPFFANQSPIMNHNPQTSPATQPEASSPVMATVLGVLASVRFAVAVVVVVAVACILGTVVPQGMETAAYLQKHPGAAGGLEVLGKLGLTDVFHSGWFISLLCVLASTLAACTTRRFATVRRTTGFARRRAFGSMLAHISLLLILAGGVIRGVWGEKGFVELQKGRTLAQFQVGNELKPLPFGLHLDEFKIGENFRSTVSPTFATEG